MVSVFTAIVAAVIIVIPTSLADVGYKPSLDMESPAPSVETLPPVKVPPPESKEPDEQCGLATTYLAGKKTADGRPYNPMGFTAAHGSFPFGTLVFVRSLRTRKTIAVRINDRARLKAGRIINLSTGSMRAIGGRGITQVCISVVDDKSHYRRDKKSPTGG